MVEMEAGSGETRVKLGVGTAQDKAIMQLNVAGHVEIKARSRRQR